MSLCDTCRLVGPRPDQGYWCEHGAYPSHNRRKCNHYIQRSDMMTEQNEPQIPSQLKCPNCGWGSRITHLRRTDTYRCGHCGHEWPKEEQ